MAAGIREKIQKLLALSKSSNEYEAYAALVKARELIAKNKLDERDFEEKKKVIKTVKLADITYTKRRDPWIISLMNLVSKNYSCEGFTCREKGKQTRDVNFVGLEEDVNVCEDVFRYALGCIYSGIEKIKKQYGSSTGLTTMTKKLINLNYGYGFINGLQKAFDKQNAENEKDWGLVLSIPKEINDYIEKNTTTDEVSKEIDIDEEIYSAGQQEGKQFTTRKKLGEEQEKIE
ncbi:DUF2786 domain-containing protein [Blautia intestinalis]|uniref:DUF2786 domain-containing protein n=1 Tax=Blautia intestinalis TaxID=2763028 RepID=UPI0022E48DC0|nr:DUF2786 domain-containing protein [Blautia intestinalis]